MSDHRSWAGELRASARTMMADINRRCRIAEGHGVGYVYVLRAAVGGLIKIGRAVDVAERVGGIQTMSPVRLELVSISHYADLETELHARHGRHRVNGEWFALDFDPLAVKTVRCAGCIAHLDRPDRFKPPATPEALAAAVKIPMKIHVLEVDWLRHESIGMWLHPDQDPEDFERPWTLRPSAAENYAVHAFSAIGSERWGTLGVYLSLIAFERQSLRRGVALSPHETQRRLMESMADAIDPPHDRCWEFWPGIGAARQFNSSEGRLEALHSSLAELQGRRGVLLVPIGAPMLDGAGSATTDH